MPGSSSSSSSGVAHKPTTIMDGCFWSTRTPHAPRTHSPHLPCPRLLEALARIDEVQVQHSFVYCFAARRIMIAHYDVYQHSANARVCARLSGVRAVHSVHCTLPRIACGAAPLPLTSSSISLLVVSAPIASRRRRRSLVPDWTALRAPNAVYQAPKGGG